MLKHLLNPRNIFYPYEIYPLPGYQDTRIFIRLHPLRAICVPTGTATSLYGKDLGTEATLFVEISIHNSTSCNHFT